LFSLLAWLHVLGAALTSISTRRFYDRVAASYDAVFRRHGVHADVMVDVLRQHVPTSDDDFVVDLACGTGFLTARLAAEGYRPIGIDFSEPSLRVLLDRLPSVAVVLADAHRLPLTSGCAAAVLCLGSWRHFADPDAVASEIARVLRPDGIAIISYFPPAFGGVIQINNAWLRRWMAWVYDHLVRLWGFVDRTGEALETEAMDALYCYFDDVRRIPSGKDCRALVARVPRAD
jgi:ubiquinone/menaquinone biosynthesis C-methylase UbiE